MPGFVKCWLIVMPDLDIFLVICRPGTLGHALGGELRVFLSPCLEPFPNIGGNKASTAKHPKDNGLCAAVSFDQVKFCTNLIRADCISDEPSTWW